MCTVHWEQYFLERMVFYGTKGSFQKIISQTCESGILLFFPEVVPMWWTLMQERNFLAQPSSTQSKRSKLATGNFPLHKMPHFWSQFGFGLAVGVEVGRTKKFCSCINVHSMETTSGENESIPRT